MSGRLVGSWTPLSRLYLGLLSDYMKTLPKDLELQQGSMLLKEDRHPRRWEYCSVLEHIHLQDGRDGNAPKILDVGGAGSLLGFFLAAHGANVTVTDLIVENVRRSLNVCDRLKLGDNFMAFNTDISKQPLTIGWESRFDVVTSVNVIEHVAEHARARVDKSFVPGLTDYWCSGHKMSKHEAEAEQAFIKGMVAVLRPGGKLIITFDYKTCGGFKCQPRCAYMRSPEDVTERIINVSGLKLEGELDLSPQQNTDRFEPPASTGIVVLRK